MGNDIEKAELYKKHNEHPCQCFFTEIKDDNIRKKEIENICVKYNLKIKKEELENLLKRYENLHLEKMKKLEDMHSENIREIHIGNKNN